MTLRLAGEEFQVDEEDVDAVVGRPWWPDRRGGSVFTRVEGRKVSLVTFLTGGRRSYINGDRHDLRRFNLRVPKEKKRRKRTSRPQPDQMQVFYGRVWLGRHPRGNADKVRKAFLITRERPAGKVNRTGFKWVKRTSPGRYTSKLTVRGRTFWTGTWLTAAAAHQAAAAIKLQQG